MGREQGWASKLTGRPPMRSPGRPRRNGAVISAFGDSCAAMPACIDHGTSPIRSSRGDATAEPV